MNSKSNRFCYIPRLEFLGHQNCCENPCFNFRLHHHCFSVLRARTGTNEEMCSDSEHISLFVPVLRARTGTNEEMCSDSLLVPILALFCYCVFLELKWCRWQ